MRNHSDYAFRYGGPEGDRTLDLRVANAALSQLSYEPVLTLAYYSTDSPNCQDPILRMRDLMFGRKNGMEEGERKSIRVLPASLPPSYFLLIS